MSRSAGVPFSSEISVEPFADFAAFAEAFAALAASAAAFADFVAAVAVDVAALEAAVVPAFVTVDVATSVAVFATVEEKRLLWTLLTPPSFL